MGTNEDKDVGRRTLCDVVMDPNSSPIMILGATIGFIEMFGSKEEVIIARAMNDLMLQIARRAIEEIDAKT